MRLGEAIYKSQQEPGGDDDRPRGGSDMDDDIVDADFEDLDDNKRAS